MKLSRTRKINISEVSQYVHDIELMSRLRARELASGNAGDDELARYDTAIECMQLVLIQLNQMKGK